MINNKIYDVSGWHEHPGGDVIFTSAGDDATDTFALFHANGTSKHLSKFLIGSLKQDDRANWPDLREKGQDQLDFEKGYRRLKMEMRRDGLFDSSLLYYVYKMSTTLMICLFSAWLVAAHSEDTASHFAARCWGGVLMGVFFQQSGWLCHEICHHQCFKNRIHGAMRRPTMVSRPWMASWPSHVHASGFFVDFELVRTESRPSRRLREAAVASMASSRDSAAATASTRRHHGAVVLITRDSMRLVSVPRRRPCHTGREEGRVARVQEGRHLLQLWVFSPDLGGS